MEQKMRMSALPGESVDSTLSPGNADILIFLKRNLELETQVCYASFGHRFIILFTIHV